MRNRSSLDKFHITCHIKALRIKLDEGKLKGGSENNRLICHPEL